VNEETIYKKKNLYETVCIMQIFQRFDSLKTIISMQHLSFQSSNMLVPIHVRNY